MSYFEVERKRIENILPHTNADKLELGKVDGMDFQFCIGKGSYQVGDEVIYFPVDSLLPKELIDAMELNFLSGRDQNRVKTIKLRGEYSQGLVLPFKDLVQKGFLSDDSPEVVTELLGVIKYEPAEVMTTSGRLNPLPQGLSKYDIEGYERFPRDLELLMTQEMVALEKMEGTNICVHFSQDGLQVCQRQHNIIYEEERNNVYWTTAIKEGLTKIVEEIYNSDYCTEGNPTIPSVSIYGELCGPSIQGNHYQLKEPTIFVFDIKINGKWIDYVHFESLVNQYDMQQAPLILRTCDLGQYMEENNLETVAQLAFGKSKVNPNVLREGIVLKPVIESKGVRLARLIMKKRCLHYLEKTGK